MCVLYCLKVMRAAAPRRIARDQPADLPAILLGRMAVDNRHQGKGLGGAMLKHFMTKAIEVSEKVGAGLIAPGDARRPPLWSARATQRPWPVLKRKPEPSDGLPRGPAATTDAAVGNNARERGSGLRW